MMGSFAAVAGLADDLYRLSHVLFGRWRGGLAYATIGSCAGFGALTGSSLATAATIGRVAIPEMESRGYSPALATGVCAAGGTLGPARAARLRTADPVCAAHRSVDRSAVRRVGRTGCAGSAALSSDRHDLCARFAELRSDRDCARATSAELRAALRRCIGVGVLVFGVMGGLYFGVFTDIESAAVGAIGAFILCGVARPSQPRRLSSTSWSKRRRPPRWSTD